MITAPNSSAKEWIFRQLAERAAHGPVRVCDLACGSGSSWHDFLLRFPQVMYVGSDTDREAIEQARRAFADVPTATFSVADAQRAAQEKDSYDVVTAFSALEHVVHLEPFVQHALTILKPDGIAYLNYDNGHFHSHDPKERLMVPVSQLLARFGIEGPYMKEVDDEELCGFIRKQGGQVLQVRKHHFSTLKGFMKKYRTREEVLNAWFAFEDRLNELVSAHELARTCGATTVVVKRV